LTLGPGRNGVAFPAAHASWSLPVGPASELRWIFAEGLSRFEVSPSLNRIAAHVNEDSTLVANPSRPTRGGRVNHATNKFRTFRQGGFLPA